MSITVSLYEDSGPTVDGHGTTRILVDNIGWKSSSSDETNEYAYNPIIRPEGVVPYTYSYKKYNYLEFHGTYVAGSRVRIKISGNITGAPPDDAAGTNKIRLFYKLTNTYEQPSNAFDGSLIYLPPGETKILYPTLSTTGPEVVGTYPQYLTADTTYYSQYLVTQLFVENDNGSMTSFGNIGELNIECYLDEYEDGNL